VTLESENAAIADTTLKVVVNS